MFVVFGDGLLLGLLLNLLLGLTSELSTEFVDDGPGRRLLCGRTGPSVVEVGLTLETGLEIGWIWLGEELVLEGEG